ncbi:MAG: response regulator [Planctomycetaceae bacterium]|nr:response regulator [Planctomycetaceae bacterium]
MTDSPTVSRRIQVLGILSRYSTAIAATGLAIWGRFLLDPWLHEECPFSLFYLSVLVTAWIGGIGPARFAIVLGSLSAAMFFIRPASSIFIEDFADFLQLSIYVIVNCVATWLFRSAERQRIDAENRSAENQRLSQSLRDADARKDEFLALLAHELRNPLAPIRSGLSLMERNPSAQQSERACQMMRRHTDHLVHLTNDLLDVSRFCRGTIKLEKSRVNLDESIENAVEMSMGLIQEKQHRIHILSPSGPLWVNGDPVRLTQMIGNLLSNAAKYTPHGGRITLRSDVDRQMITISVEDNGIGFPPGEVDHILEPFVQMNMSRTRDHGGLGVGLAIVDRLAGLHGGRLIAHSNGPGLGSCFTLELPSAEIASNVNQSPTHAQSDASNSLSHSVQTDPTETAESRVASNSGPARVSGRRVLLVDDNVDAAQLLADLLRTDGYDVLLAHDGFAALETASQEKTDVIVLDIGLPGLDGLEVARRLRRSPATAMVKLVALSGWASISDRKRGKEAGFDTYLVKPVNYLELRSALETLQSRAEPEMKITRQKADCIPVMY